MPTVRILPSNLRHLPAFRVMLGRPLREAHLKKTLWQNVTLSIAPFTLPPMLNAGIASSSKFLLIFRHKRNRSKSPRKSSMKTLHSRGCTSLATEIEHGSRLTFELRMKGLEVEDSIQHLIWRGRAESVQFEVVVPDTEKPGTKIGTVLISQDSVPIGQVKFKLKVVDGATATCEREPTGEAHRYHMAFISYASEDRVEVLRRVQMLKAAGIRFFQDVLNLDPGQRWEQSIYRHIDQSDVVFLFWSTAAKNSEWVAREWNYALQTKGDDCVRPVIIEGPPIVPPPPELSHLHFNDQVLYFLAAS